MEINRNQYFMAGVIVLLLGIQLRMVDSYTLNAKTTEILAKRTAASDTEGRTMMAATFMSNSRKVIHPPDWLGWMLVSVGSVLVLHSLAMKKPG